jgi:hypothetical protein
MLLHVLILSHERPALLKQQLLSLSPLLHFEQCLLTVSDNSTSRSGDVQGICHDFPGVHLIQQPGITQVENFFVFRSLTRSKYLWILHDDDVVFLKSAKHFLQFLQGSESELIYINSFEIRSEFPFKIKAHHFDTTSISPYDLIFPHCLPAFPAYIYHWTYEFETSFVIAFSPPPFGKYSDTGFVVDYISFLLLKPALNCHALLFHRWHSGSDVNTFDLISYLKLLRYALPRISSLFRKIRAIFVFGKEVIAALVKALMKTKLMG